jgi:hypothetical protein
MNWEKHFRAMKRSSPVPTEFGSDFGAVERGIKPAGVTDAAVIPPGRYWLDVYGDKIARFHTWAQGKPEVLIETSQEDTSASPPHLFVIFSIPTTASNFGMSGVLFPTTDLGFPEGADASVQSADDVVQKPAAETSGQVFSNIVHTTSDAAGTAAQGFLSVLTPRTILLGALALGAVIFIGTLPGAVLRKAL